MTPSATRTSSAPAELHSDVAGRIAGRAPELEALWARIPDVLDRAPGEVLVSLDKSPCGLGESWVAEEAIASAMYCFWRHPDDARACILEGVNTDGDSDSIAAIAGGIVGARVGIDGLPAEWVRDVEDSAALQDLAERLWRARSGDSGIPRPAP